MVISLRLNGCLIIILRVPSMKSTIGLRIRSFKADGALVLVNSSLIRLDNSVPIWLRCSEKNREITSFF